MYTVYSKDNCVFCERAKNLLKINQQEFVEIKLGRDMPIDEFKTKYPNQRTVPLILKDGQEIGGYTDLEEYLRVEAPVMMQSRN
ncbi:MAG: glutaredoxin [Fischerella sp.]|nr:glutaredoxin [Fischerella sp.]